MPIQYSTCLTAILAWITYCMPSLAAEHYAAIEKYLTDDVVAVGVVDVSRVDPVAVVEWVHALGLSDAEQQASEISGAKQIGQTVDQFLQAGGKQVYVLIDMAEITGESVGLVIPVAESGDPRAVVKLLKQVFFYASHTQAGKHVVLAASNEGHLQKLRDAHSVSHDGLKAALESLENTAIGLAISAGPDQRRVLREMFPQLPPPFDGIDGKLLADGVRWASVQLDLPPKPNLRITVQTSNPESASVLQHAANTALTVIKNNPQVQQTFTNADRDTLFAALTPKKHGSQLTISSEDLQNDVARITRLLSPPIKQARQRAWRNQRLNQFKQIALGLQNYADRKKSFPAPATYDQAGKPLLSWRVHILPELEQGKLYKQFHLDEPWDSEHNRKLVAKMPSIYADPDSALRKLKQSGRTTYVVPVAPETVFPKHGGIRFKDITDGTSNTIMFVEVVPERAVVWTEPADWEVDLSDPWNGVRRNGRDGFTSASCDGSARVYDSSLPAKKLRALLTRAGEEVIEWP